MEVHKCGKGFFGYNYVNAELESVDGYVGWKLTCDDPGHAGCSAPDIIIPQSGSDLDIVDAQESNNCLAAADSLIQLGSSTGTYTITVQVSGESFQRVYQVTWTPTTNEDGYDGYYYVVDRNDVNI